MRVVYSPLHLGHDITTQTVLGVQVPANEVAARAERMLVKPGMGFDEGLCIVGNEMARTVAILRGR